jgi:hypothetical protein
MGSDLDAAKPGDLLLLRNHVVMLIRSLGNGRGDIIHSTRGRRANQPGGIQKLFNVKLKRFRGPLLKILRHVEMLPKSDLDLPSVPKNAMHLRAAADTPREQYAQ